MHAAGGGFLNSAAMSASHAPSLQLNRETEQGKRKPEVNECVYPSLLHHNKTSNGVLSYRHVVLSLEHHVDVLRLEVLL